MPLFKLFVATKVFLASMPRAFNQDCALSFVCVQIELFSPHSGLNNDHNFTL